MSARAREGFRFDPPDVELSSDLHWVLLRAFAPAEAPAPVGPLAEPVRLAAALGLAARIASRHETRVLEREAGADAAEELRGVRAQAAALELRLGAALAGVARVAAERKVPFAPLKGRALVLAGFADPLGRPAADVDLLVPERRLDELQRALVEAGFRDPGNAVYEHQAPLLLHAAGGAIELHRTIPGVRLDGRRSATFESLERAGFFEEWPVASGREEGTSDSEVLRFAQDDDREVRRGAGDEGGEGASPARDDEKEARVGAGGSNGESAPSAVILSGAKDLDARSRGARWGGHHRPDLRGDLRLPAREVLLAHALVHTLAQHAFAAAHSGFQLVADLIDLGPAACAADLARVGPWIEREVGAEEVGAALDLARDLAEGELGGLAERGAPAARLAAHFVACATDPAYGVALKARLLESPLSDRPRALARLILLGRTLAPPGGGGAGAWLRRSADLLARWRAARSARRR